MHACGGMQFYSFDLEMTGLFLQDAKEEYLDDILDRYRVVTIDTAALALGNATLPSGRS